MEKRIVTGLLTLVMLLTLLPVSALAAELPVVEEPTPTSTSVEPTPEETGSTLSDAEQAAVDAVIVMIAELLESVNDLYDMDDDAFDEALAAIYDANTAYGNLSDAQKTQVLKNLGELVAVFEELYANACVSLPICPDFPFCPVLPCPGGDPDEGKDTTEEPTTGTLIVTKTVIGLEDSDYLPDNFQITVTDANYNLEVLKLAGAEKRTEDSRTIYTWTIGELTPGKYSISESGYDVPGYNVAAEENTTAEVVADNIATASLTNKYIKNENEPGLSVTKSIEKVLRGDETVTLGSGDEVQVGDTIIYKIAVENTGNVPLTNVVLTDTFDGEGTLVFEKSDTVTVVENDDGTYTINIAIIEVGETYGITYTYTVTNEDAEKGSINNEVTVESDEGGSGSDEESVGVGAVTILTVEKELTEVNGRTYSGSRNVYVGDRLTYTITVTNNTGADLENLTLTDELPSGLRGTDLKETFDLDAGESITFTITATVRSSAEGSRLTNTAVVTDEDGKELDRDSETVRVGYSSTGTVDRPSGAKPSLNTEDHVGYIIGYEDGTVRPQNNITRAEVATIFFRLMTDESRDYYWSQTNSYSDVSIDDWFNNAVSTLTNAGIIDGYVDGTFRPDDYVTRAEFAAIAARFSEVICDGEVKFSDVPDTYWAFDEISVAYQEGWITGYEDGTFRPNQDITRAEAMTLVNRVLERAVEEDHMLDDMFTWSDNRPSAWYYEDVQEATNSHEYTRTDDEVPNQDYNYEDWVEILDVPDWAALERAWSTANSY